MPERTISSEQIDLQHAEEKKKLEKVGQELYIRAIGLRTYCKDIILT